MQANLVMTLAAALALGACAIGGDDGRPDGELRGPGIGGEDSEPAGDDEGVRLDLPVVGSSSTGAEPGSTGTSNSTGESSTGAGVDDGSTGGDTDGPSSTGTSSTGSTGGEGSSGDTSTGGGSTGDSSSSTGPEPEPEPEPPAVCGDGVCSGAELQAECWVQGSFCFGDCSKRPDCETDCPCTPGAINVCNLHVGACSATKPGGLCDPNGDGAFFDGEWTLGQMQYQAKCG